jgi:hypothetical protein
MTIHHFGGKSDRVPLAQLKSIVLDTTIQTAVGLFTHVALLDDIKVDLKLSKIESLGLSELRFFGGFI